MKYIFFTLISITLFSLFFYKKYFVQIGLLISTLLVLMIIYPQASLNSAKEGINLWLFVVIPSLMPFFIINDMLIALKIPENISRLFAPIARILFNTSGYGAYVFIMSIFSGYPAGAKITAQLIENNKITAEEGQRILTFSSTSGPLFIIGAVGSGMLNNPIAGYILFISHILGSILNGIITRIFMKGTYINKPISNIENQYKDFNSVLSSAIGNSLVTSGFIGGYIILFSVVIELLNKINFFDTLAYILNKFFIPETAASLISSTLEASIEISNGCKILSQSGINLSLLLCIISFIIAFSGFSIIGQVFGVIGKTKINLKVYVLTKLSHGVLSALSCYAIINLKLFPIEIFNYNLPSFINLLSLLLIALLIIILILNASSQIICSKKR